MKENIKDELLEFNWKCFAIKKCKYGNLINNHSDARFLNISLETFTTGDTFKVELIL